MKIILYKLAVFQVLMLVCNGPAFGGGADPQSPHPFNRSLVSIMSFDRDGRRLSSGSGFFINNTGDITTNHHLLAGSDKAVIETTEGERGIIVEIIGDNPEFDLTVARTTIRGSIPLLLGDSDRVEVGEDIVVLGDSPRAGKAISLGVIKRMLEAEGVRLIEITASIRPGRSGAPVLNSAGRVIGIATAFLDYGMKKNFAMPVNYLKSLQPTRLKLRSLPKSVARFDAVLKDETFVEVHARGSETPGESDRSFDRETLDGQGSNGKNGSDVGEVFASGIIYFKDGKRLLCERVWKQGKNVYLQVHDKEIVVSYDESEIDIERSFNGPGLSGEGD
jgi:S1-C subfamily serine protease